VRTHASHVVDGKQYAVVSYRDTAGVSCVAVDVDGYWGWPLSGLRADDRNLLSYRHTMATRGHGIAVIFGVAAAENKRLKARNDKPSPSSARRRPPVTAGAVSFPACRGIRCCGAPGPPR
jgi:hypothetical protein